jgi:hypothetical protein
LCNEASHAFNDLKAAFGRQPVEGLMSPDSRIISLLTGLELTLAYAHGSLLEEPAKGASPKLPEHPGFFGNMVSGVFSGETAQARSNVANNRLSVLLSLEDAVCISFAIWSWRSNISQGGLDDNLSQASFVHTSTRTRNKARRLLERLFTVEPVECPEVLIAVWCKALDADDDEKMDSVIDLLHVLDGSRPKVTVSAVFAAIQSRTSPGTRQDRRKSTLTSHLTDADLVAFLSEYAQSIDADAMEEIWTECVTFLRDVLANPFPHRQVIPKLLQFTGILGEKMHNTRFGNQRMRRDLSVRHPLDLFFG